MPWLETDPMTERLKFVQDALSDRFTMAEVCARVRAQLRLRSSSEGQKQQAERLQLIVDGMDEGLMIIEASGRIQFSNPACDRYLGYERNETYGWRQQLKQALYMLFPFHSALRLSRTHYAHYYPKNISALVAQAGFHDCTHAYAITQAGARKLLQRQTPVAYNPDNLLSFAIAEQAVKGYISRPKLFNQRTAFVHEMASLTS